LGTVIKQPSVPDALTNYRLTGYSEAISCEDGDVCGVIEPINSVQGIQAGHGTEVLGIDGCLYGNEVAGCLRAVDKMPELLNPNKCLN